MHRRIWALSLPLVLSNISVPLLGVVNAALMGHLNTTAYLAASGLGIACINFISYLFYFLRMSTTGLIAQHYVKRELSKILNVTMVALALAFIIGVLVLLLKPLIMLLLLWVLHLNGAVNVYFIDFLSIALFAIPFILINYVFLGVLIAIRKPKIALIMALICNGSGILISIMGVMLGYTIKALAYSSIFSQIITSVLIGSYLFHWVKHQGGVSYLYACFHFKWILNNTKTMIIFFGINRDIFIRSICLLVGINSFYLFSSYLGKDITAVNTLLLEFAVLLGMALDAISNATEVLVAEAYAKKNDHQLGLVLKYTFLHIFGFVMIFVVLYAITYPYVISMLTSLSEIRRLAEHYIIFSLIFPLVAVIGYWADGVCIGLLKTKLMRNAMMIAILGYFLCLSMLWSFHNIGLWISFMIFFMLRAVAQTYFMLRATFFRG